MKICVVMPVYNEEKHVAHALTAIIDEKEKYNIIDKIIVVDNYSTDQSLYIINIFTGIDVLQVQGNISVVRNEGARYNTSEVIAFIDGDCVVKDGWSKEVMRLIHNKFDIWPAMIFGSAVTVSDNPGWIERVWFKAISEGSKGKNHINSGNLILSSSLFTDLNGFNESLSSSEDVDICQRSISTGALLLEEPAIQAKHLGFPKTLKNFYRRERWHGKGMLNSSGGLLNNKAMMLSLLTIIAVTAFILLLFIRITAAPYVLIIYFTINLFLGSYICKPKGFIDIILAAILMSFYSLARTISLVESIFLKPQKQITK